MNTPRFLLYTRQSLTKGEADESLSLAFQERALRELVKKQGGIVLEPVIVDADEKGWDPNRPGIAKLIDRTERERPDGVAVYAVSRFARDNWLAEGIWRRLISLQPELQFISVTEPHAHDDMVRGILGVISQAERKRMGAFLRSSFRERARRGLPHGKVPFGYTRGDDGHLSIVTEERDAILWMIDRFEAGWSFRRIARDLTERGEFDRRWQSSSVRIIICNPAIAGAVRCGDVFEWDCHEAIVTRERHERLVETWQSQRVIRTKNVSSWLERLMICGCGLPMDMNSAGNPYGDISRFRCIGRRSGPPKPDVPCTYSPHSILVRKAERMVPLALMEDLAFIPDWREVEERLIRDFHTRDTAAERDALVREQQKIERERDRLLLLYRRATLEVDRWEDEDGKLKVRLASVTEQIAAIPEPPSSASLRERAGVLSDLRDRIQLLASAEPTRLGSIMREFEIRAQLSDGNVRILWPDPLAVFFS